MAYLGQWSSKLRFVLFSAFKFDAYVSTTCAFVSTDSVSGVIISLLLSRIKRSPMRFWPQTLTFCSFLVGYLRGVQEISKQGVGNHNRLWFFGDRAAPYRASSPGVTCLLHLLHLLGADTRCPCPHLSCLKECQPVLGPALFHLQVPLMYFIFSLQVGNNLLNLPGASLGAHSTGLLEQVSSQPPPHRLLLCSLIWTLRYRILTLLIRWAACDWESISP